MEYVVIDLIYTKDEHNEIFSGTWDECFEWKHEQGGFGYQIVPKHYRK